MNTEEKIFPQRGDRKKMRQDSFSARGVITPIEGVRGYFPEGVWGKINPGGLK